MARPMQSPFREIYIEMNRVICPKLKVTMLNLVPIQPRAQRVGVLSHSPRRFEPPRHGPLRPRLKLFEIPHVENISKLGIRDDATHESVNYWNILHRIPQQVFPRRWQLEVAPQVLDDEQLRPVTGGEYSVHQQRYPGRGRAQSARVVIWRRRAGICLEFDFLMGVRA